MKRDVAKQMVRAGSKRGSFREEMKEGPRVICKHIKTCSRYRHDCDKCENNDYRDRFKGRPSMLIRTLDKIFGYK